MELFWLAFYQHIQSNVSYLPQPERMLDKQPKRVGLLRICLSGIIVFILFTVGALIPSRASVSMIQAAQLVVFFNIGEYAWYTSTKQPHDESFDVCRTVRRLFREKLVVFNNNTSPH